MARSDFELRIRGEISAAEYVRRLDNRVRENRLQNMTTKYDALRAWFSGFRGPLVKPDPANKVPYRRP